MIVGWKTGKEELNWKKDKIWREKEMRNRKVFWVIFFPISLNIFRIRLANHFCEASDLVSYVWFFHFRTLNSNIYWQENVGFGHRVWWDRTAAHAIVLCAFEWFSDSLDSRDFKGSSDDEENRLCNTVLITGPTGVGKTAAVYACAQELGFKVSWQL